jgi:hypothetical protein
MIRFILKRHLYDNHSRMESEEFRTIDIDVPELQKILLSGGFGLEGHDRTELVGVEIRS